MEFDEKKLVKFKHEEVQTEKEGLTEKKVLKKDPEAQTETEDNPEMITLEVIEVTSIGVNTGEEEIEILEKHLEVDSNGQTSWAEQSHTQYFL